MIVKGYDFSDVQLQPPHDMIGEKVTNILPRGKNAEFLIELIAKSVHLFKNHKINRARKRHRKECKQVPYGSGAG